MEKLTKEQRQDLVMSYSLDSSKANMQLLLDKYKISKTRLFQIMKEEKKQEIEKSIIASDSNFTKKANRIIDLLFERIEKELVNNDKITLSQLSTTLGILYDKSRLENNLSTSNNSININIKVEK